MYAFVHLMAAPSMICFVAPVLRSESELTGVLKVRNYGAMWCDVVWWQCAQHNAAGDCAEGHARRPAANGNSLSRLTVPCMLLPKFVIRVGLEGVW
jgi:hypothetical protein